MKRDIDQGIKVVLINLLENIGIEEDESRLKVLICNALSFDKVNTIKALFYIRDKIQGMGRRSIFHNAFSQEWLGEYEDIRRLVISKKLFWKLVSEFGSWKSAISLGLEIKSHVLIEVISDQLKHDYQLIQMGRSSNISMVAKWIPRESNVLGRKYPDSIESLRNSLGMSKRSYKRMLGHIRSHIPMVERDMCALNWESIDFDNVTNGALRKYNKAFLRHCGDKYINWLKVKNEGGIERNRKDKENKVSINLDIISGERYRLIEHILVGKLISK